MTDVEQFFLQLKLMRERKAGKLTDDEYNAAMFALLATPIERKSDELEGVHDAH